MRRSNQFLLLIIALGIGSVANGQNSLSFYHLGDATYQNSNFNPAWMPDARVFIGLPVLSGIHVGINNKFSYNDIFTKEGNNNVAKVSSVISELQKQNMFNLQANISLLHLGYRFPNGTVMSVFANERVEADLLYPKTLMQFLWEGNTTNIGETLELGSMGVNVTHFREIGFGIAHQVDEKMKVGARIKLLQGFLNFSTPRDMVANLKLDPQTYAWDLETENVMLRSSGKTAYGNNFVSPGNSGFAVDVGFEYNYSRYLSFSGSLTDLGFISWNEDIENRVFNDTTFNYTGVNIKGIDNIETALQDSLIDKFSTVRTTDAYKNWLPAKAYGSVTYRYGSTYFIGTMGARYIQGQMKMLYGGGIRQKLGPLTASVSAMKLPQQFINLGAALAVRGGPVQYYIAADQLLSLSVPDAKAFDFRTGLNITIGRASQGPSSRGSTTSYSRDQSRKSGNKGISTGSFLGTKVKTKKREGIYSIISKQKKREVPKSITPPKASRKKSAAPRSSPPPTQKKAPKKKRN